MSAPLKVVQMLLWTDRQDHLPAEYHLALLSGSRPEDL
jgi:hypothetical protein